MAMLEKFFAFFQNDVLSASFRRISVSADGIMRYLPAGALARAWPRHLGPFKFSTGRHS